MVSYHLTKGEQLENILNHTFKEIEDITDVHQMTNQQLKRLIQKIEVDKEGNVDIYLRLLGDLGLDESVLIEGNETVLNCNDQTQGCDGSSDPYRSVPGGTGESGSGYQQGGAAYPRRHGHAPKISRGLRRFLAKRAYLWYDDTKKNKPQRGCGEGAAR